MNIQIKISARVYLKDPEESELGRKIISECIPLIDEIGIENFTFKKLAKRIKSTEASIYRYFENKHKLLIYLLSWYWNWLSYQFTFGTHNVDSAKERLQIAIRIIAHAQTTIPDFTDVDIQALYRIVIAESPKTYLTKEVDAENKEGYFLSYKGFCRQVADVVLEINPDYPYSNSLISTAIEAAHHQKYFSEHLPSLTEVSNGNREEVAAFLTDMVFKTVGVE